MSAISTPTPTFPQWHLLPAEVQGFVASHLGPTTLKNLAETCRSNALLVRTPYIWKPLAERLGFAPSEGADPKIFVKEKALLLQKLKKHPKIKELWESVQHLPEEERLAKFFQRKKAEDYAFVAEKVGYVPPNGVAWEETVADIEKWVKKGETQLNLTTYTSLDLKDGQLVFLPPWIGDLSKLKTLDLSYNYLASIPEEVGKLNQISRLFLIWNNFKEIPLCIKKLRGLKDVRIDGNFITKIPHWLTRRQDLETLSLSANQIEKLPKDLSGLKNLAGLDLSWNFIKRLPSSIEQLQSLTYLVMVANHLSHLPSSISHLWGLTYLNLGLNRFKKLPEPLVAIADNTRIILSEVGQMADLAKRVLLGDGVPPNGEKAMEIFEEARSLNGGEEQNCVLAEVYPPKLTGMPPGRTEAQWCARRAKLGDARAQETLGDLYLNRERRYQRNAQQKGLKWLELAAMQGRATAQEMLATWWRKRGEEERAVEWYRRSARNGNDQAKVSLAALLYKKKSYRLDDDPTPLELASCGGYKSNPGNLGVYLHDERRYREALSWVHKGAEKNHSWCLGTLAAYLRYGVAGPKDPVQAEKWREKALRFARYKGSFQLGSVLSTMYDYEEAYRHFLDAARTGDHAAQFQVSVCLVIGLGVDQDLKGAVKWLRKGAGGGNAHAPVWLAILYLHGMGVEKDTERAVQLLQEANTPTSLAWMATARLEGMTSHHSSKEAIQLLETAWQRGETGASSYLGSAYLMGLGTDPDPQQAAQWFLKRLKHGRRVDTLYGLKLLAEKGVKIEGRGSITEKEWQEALLNDSFYQVSCLAADVATGVWFPQDLARASRLFDVALRQMKLPQDLLGVKKRLFVLKCALSSAENNGHDQPQVKLFTEWIKQLENRCSQQIKS